MDMETGIYGHRNVENIENLNLLLDSPVNDSQNVNIFHIYLTIELFK
jgi:hypothetical protein